MKSIGISLCRLGWHKWGKAQSGMDLTNAGCGVMKAKRCKRCGLMLFTQYVYAPFEEGGDSHQ